MIPTGIPLGRKPREHRAGALLWLEGNKLRPGTARAVNPFGMAPWLCLVFLFFGKNTSFPHGFRVELDGSGISPGFSVCGRQISSLGALKSHLPAGSMESLAQPRGFVPPKESFFLPFPPNSLSFGTALKQVSPCKWRVASSVL